MAATHEHSGASRAGGQVEPKLAGLRVLVVEDSFLAAASISRMLSDLGCRVVGPVSSVDKAVPLIDAGRCDAGVLDINLAGQTSEPIADRLAELKLPYLFVTGYASPMLLSSRQRAHTRLHKPIAERELRDALVRTVQRVP